MLNASRLISADRKIMCKKKPDAVLISFSHAVTDLIFEANRNEKYRVIRDDDGEELMVQSASQGNCREVINLDSNYICFIDRCELNGSR